MIEEKSIRCDDINRESSIFEKAQLRNNEVRGIYAGTSLILLVAMFALLYAFAMLILNADDSAV